MAWRVARSLETLRNQVNVKWPNRSKASDGSIGDEAHASRSSDHNPWVKDGTIGIVTAIDITHDPKSGCDSYALAEALLKSRDSRIKYVISNGKIAAGPDGPQPWVWRKYTGANAHAHHVHISVKADKAHYDDTRAWVIGDGKPAITAAPRVEDIGVGKDARVEAIQNALIAMGFPEVGTVDGRMGIKTTGAVSMFLKANGLSSYTSIDTLLDYVKKRQREGFTRGVPPERAFATPADVAAKVPAVASNATTRTAAKVTTIATAGVGIITNLPDAINTWVPALSSVKSIASGVPGWVWLALLLIGAGAFWWNSRRTERAAVADYQTGRTS